MALARPRSVTAALGVYFFALSLWMGGLLVLGAIVAPTVFRIVPAPSSADAMTIVFRKFDAVAISCALVCLFAEAMLAWRGGKASRQDLVRSLSVALATACAITVGAWLSPAIQALHRSGAVRNVGADGLELERLHRIAESTAKIEVALLAAVLVLTLLRARRPT
jgi:uncharacterized membrane protein